MGLTNDELRRASEEPEGEQRHYAGKHNQASHGGKGGGGSTTGTFEAPASASPKASHAAKAAALNANMQAWLAQGGKLRRPTRKP